MRRNVLIAAVVMILSVMFGSVPAMARSSASAALNMVIPSAKLTDIPLVDALDFVVSITNVNLVVDWKSLEAANVSKQAMVNLNLHTVKAGRLLTMILSEAAGGDTLTWYVDGGVVEVTTKDVSDSKMITVVYYVEDLIMANMPFNGIPTNGNSLQFSASITSGTPTAGGGGGGGASGSGEPSTFGQNSSQTGTATVSEDTVAQGLIKLIENAIRPEIWTDHGGKAVIDYYNGHLIVTAPRSVQEAIGGPLN